MSPADQKRVDNYLWIAAATTLVEHIPALSSCKRYIKSVSIKSSLLIIISISCRRPEIAFAERMASRSECHVLDISDDDPSTTRGCTSVLLNLRRCSPLASECGEVFRKKVVFGDQALVALSRRCASSRSDEKAPERLNNLIPQPQDFHAKMVRLSACCTTNEIITCFKENIGIYRQFFVKKTT